jgi:hypothetical protein
MKIDWLNPILDDNGDIETYVYSLSELKKNNEVIEVCEDGYVVWNKTKDYWYKFAVMQFHYSVDDENTFVTPIFIGEGPSDNLRECRHTQWGTNGYIFYPDGQIIVAAFKELAKYYDDME